jgi:hypothetical protein
MIGSDRFAELLEQRFDIARQTHRLQRETGQTPRDHTLLGAGHAATKIVVLVRAGITLAQSPRSYDRRA